MTLLFATRAEALPQGARAHEILPHDDLSQVVEDSTWADQPYTLAEVEHFQQIALDRGGPSRGIVKKWKENVRIAIYGQPSESDLLALAEAMLTLNRQIKPLRIVPDKENPTLRVYFVSREQYNDLAPRSHRNTLGYTFYRWGDDGELHEARTLIAMDKGVKPSYRASTIQHELLHGLGFTNHATSISILSLGGMRTQGYSQLDLSALRMLYREDIEPGMETEDVLEALMGAPATGLPVTSREVQVNNYKIVEAQ